MSVIEEKASETESCPQTSGLADLLLSAAKNRPGGGIYVVPSRSDHGPILLTHDTLLNEARQFLTGLRSVRPQGSRIVLLIDQPRDFLPLFWACILGGYIPCPMSLVRNDRDRWVKQLEHLNMLLDGPLFVCAGTLTRELPRSVKFVELSNLCSEKQTLEIWRAVLSEPAVLMLTSGSTGNSKAVTLTHETIMASLIGKTDRRGLTSADVMLNWVSFDHVIALLEAHLLPLSAHATQVHIPPGIILAEPLMFLRIISHFRITVSFTPNFLLGHINAAVSTIDIGSENLDLTCIRHIITGGEANPVETALRFLRLLAPYGLSAKSLWPAYGMTETCAAAVVSTDFPEDDSGREFASVGSPLKGLELRIVNVNGHPLPHGETGELEVRGPLVFNQYYNDAEATRTAFTADGWFRTGDLGTISSNRLRLVGRSKDSIIVNGVNYFSHELEGAVELLDGIERSYVAAFPTRPSGVNTEELVVVFSPEFSLNDEARLLALVVAVKNTATMLWGFRPSWVLPMTKDAFPKTNLGKIQRTLMRRRFEEGKFADALSRVAAMTKRHLGHYVSPEGVIETGVAALFAEIFTTDPNGISATANFFDLGGTSLDILKLTGLLEHRFGLETSLITVLQNPTVKALTGLIENSEHRSPVEYDPIITLQHSGDKLPLFFIHPGDGGSLVFVNLSRYFLNDRPVYALRPRGFHENEQNFTSLDELVDTYLNAICQTQPKEPYALCGYSLGGIICFEIAKKLEAQGKRVSFVGAIDTQPPGEGLSLDFGSAVLGSAELLESMDAKKFSEWARVGQSLQHLARDHVLTGKVAAMTIFCSDGFPAHIERQQWCDRLRLWNEFAREAKYVQVTGDHMTLMGPRHVAKFQAALRHELNAALNGL